MATWPTEGTTVVRRRVTLNTTASTDKGAAAPVKVQAAETVKDGAVTAQGVGVTIGAVTVEMDGAAARAMAGALTAAADQVA